MNQWNASRPNNELAALPPIGFRVTAEQSLLLLEVVGLLARLDEAADLLANPSVFNNALPMLEIASSSRIENIITTHDEMFVASVSTTQPVTPATRLAMKNRAAMNFGFSAVVDRPISVKLLGEIASGLLGYEVAVRSLPGTFIGDAGNRTYTPPEGKELLASLLGDLVEFIGSSEMHPVLVMIFAHYQFEAIHPYPDGNGRTGRVLNHLILTQAGLLRAPVLNLSTYLVRHREEYYRRLHGVESLGDWAGWITFMLGALRSAVLDSYSKMKELTFRQLKFSEELMPLVGKSSDELSQLLFEKPYCQIGHVVERLGVSRPTASKFLEALVRAGLLTSFVSGKEKFFVNKGMLEVLAK
jgi:Fic family protein